MKKFGAGEIIPESTDDVKIAKKHFTSKDREELIEEITEDDARDTPNPE